jgi:3-keto-5-aminohexanoate cleavage enzyme
VTSGGTAPAAAEANYSWAPPPLQPYRPMVITVALTGAVPTKAGNVCLPVTPEEIAADAIACAHEGASVVHVHVRDQDGVNVHRRDLYERALAPIRAAVPDLVICVTTSSRVDPDPATRMIGLELPGDLKPDLASLTLGSFNVPNAVNVNPPATMVALVEHMLECGVRPEFEVFELGMINTLYALADRGLVPDVPVVNILLGSMGAAPAFVGDLAQTAARLPSGTEWAGAGIGVFQRPIVIGAAVLGGNVRTGLEDDPCGTAPGWSNVEAVRFAVRAAELAGRTIATRLETRRRFGLVAEAGSDGGRPSAARVGDGR